MNSANTLQLSTRASDDASPTWRPVDLERLGVTGEIVGTALDPHNAADYLIQTTDGTFRVPYEALWMD